jgi:hypothetical protein
MKIPPVSFEAVDERGTGIYEFIFMAAGACVCVGAVYPFMGPQPPRWMVSFMIASAGIVGFAWLFRYLPRTKYFVYFALDELGIHHRSSVQASIDLIPWSRVIDVQPHYAKDEAPNMIELQLISSDGRARTNRLPMTFRHHVDRAVSAIREVLTEASSNHRVESDAIAHFTRTR